MVQGKSAPEFKIYNAHELAAQRVVLQGDVEAERTVPEECRIASGDWVYSVEENGDKPGLEGKYAMIVSYSGAGGEISIPSEIDGYEVRELFNQVFARNAAVKSVVMPNTVKRIGLKTFFQCANLESVTFSDALDEFDSQTLTGCRSLTKLHLPRSLKAISRRLVFDCPLEVLLVPAGAELIEDQAFDPKKVGKIEVDADNENYSTDGYALYTKDGNELIQIAIQVSEYEIPEGCSIIGESAFKGCTSLEKISLGSGVREIKDFAFFRTSISELACPESLEVIGESAFSLCAKLESVSFNEGLKSIGAQAFSKTPLGKVVLPASLEYLGKKVFERTKLVFDDSNSFAIAPDNPTLFAQANALYRKTSSGTELCGLLSDVQELVVREGTVSIAEGAFERESKLERVVLPDGLKHIGAKAFKACDKLCEVNLPDSLETIGEEAFWQTSLKEVHIGPHVAQIGPYAFEVAGACRKHDKRTLTLIEVDGANEKYYVEQNILIERREGGDKALMFYEPLDYVEIPRAVTEIAETAFYHAHVREMRFHSGIQTVGPRALLGIDELDRVYVEFPEPVDGFSEVTVEFPYQARDMEDFTRPLCIDKDGLFFDFATYDSMVVHEIDPTTVVRMILARFEQPVKLGEAARAYFESAMKGFMNQVLRRYAQESNFEGYERLAKNGYFDEETKALALRIAESEQAEDAIAYLKGRQ